MRVTTDYIQFSTKGNNDIIDITDQIEERLQKTKMSEGSVLAFVSGSTGGLTTMEYEPGQVEDLKDACDRIIPRNQDYAHNHSLYGSDGNAHSHLRASFIGSDITIPFKDSKLLLGTWQQVVFIDFDVSSRNRKIVLQFTGQ
ncbi:secondary thiamine-phosphate synthase enzyme YjbQ [Thermoproteota archaeon]